MARNPQKKTRVGPFRSSWTFWTIRIAQPSLVSATGLPQSTITVGSFAASLFRKSNNADRDERGSR